MNHPKQDLTGLKFGRWTALSYYGYVNKRSLWNVKCECGNERKVDAYFLTSGKSKSCGCYRSEKQTKHGRTGSPEYSVWEGMKERCYNPKSTFYHHYGGRGIIICDRWKDSFKNFFEDMGERPTLKHSIDRIDNDGIYEPSNCKWATQKEQRRNSRQNVFLSYGSTTMIFEDWSIFLEIHRDKLRSKLRKIPFDKIVESYVFQLPIN